MRSYSFYSLFLAFCGFLKFSHTENCPAIVISCSCKKAAIGILVQCKVDSLEELTHEIKVFHGLDIYSLIIKDSTFEFLPNNLFENVTIKELSIYNSNFSRIGNLGVPQFQGLEDSLQTLKFAKSFSKLYPLAFVHLENLKKLAKLEVRDSYVELIHNRWFKDGPKSLRVIRFVNGNIGRIGYNAFQNLTNLRIIDLSNNELNYIPRWAFPEPATYLTEINLERNKFESLPEDFFSQMPNLARVNLELNQFSTIDEKVWTAVWLHLDYVNIDYNPMICDKRIQWIFDSETDLEHKLIGTYYKPFSLMDRDIHSLEIGEIKF